MRQGRRETVGGFEYAAWKAVGTDLESTVRTAFDE
jgi:hypothetical protein